MLQQSHAGSRVTKATKLVSALGELSDPQIGLLLLRHCVSFGKLFFSTRVVPDRLHSAALRSFDIAVHECFESSLRFFQPKNGRSPLCPQHFLVWSFAQRRNTAPPGGDGDLNITLLGLRKLLKNNDFRPERVSTYNAFLLEKSSKARAPNPGSPRQGA